MLLLNLQKSRVFYFSFLNKRIQGRLRQTPRQERYILIELKERGKRFQLPSLVIINTTIADYYKIPKRGNKQSLKKCRKTEKKLKSTS